MDYNKFRLYLLGEEVPPTKMIDCLDYIDREFGFSYFVGRVLEGLVKCRNEFKGDDSFNMLLRNLVCKDVFGYDRFGGSEGEKFRNMFRLFYYSFKHSYCMFLSC